MIKACQVNKMDPTRRQMVFAVWYYNNFSVAISCLTLIHISVIQHCRGTASTWLCQLKLNLSSHKLNNKYLFQPNLFSYQELEGAYRVEGILWTWEVSSLLFSKISLDYLFDSILTPQWSRHHSSPSCWRSY